MKRVGQYLSGASFLIILITIIIGVLELREQAQLDSEIGVMFLVSDLQRRVLFFGILFLLGIILWILGKRKKPS